MQAQHLKLAAKSLAPPKPFTHPRDEASFQSEYIRTGYGFAVAVTLVGTLMSLAFIVTAKLSPLDGTGSFELQLLRTIIGLACGLSFFSLLFDPERSLRNYRVTIFLPAFISLIGLGLLLFVPRPEAASAIAYGRSTLSLVIAVWLVSAFCRLPLKQIMAMTMTASILNLVGLYVHGVEHLPFFVIDLLLANLIVWTLTVQIEKRERLIWHQAMRSRNATRKAQNSAKQATVISNAQARLLRSVGHDIRQPLSSSGIYLGVVTRAAQQSANEVMEQNLARVRTCLRSVEGTLERLMEVPGDDNDLTLKTSRTDLSRIFQDLRDVFEPQADRLGVELRFTQSCSGPVLVRTNERAIREVLSNIVANSIKYSAIVSQRSPSVVVGSVRIGDTVRVDVVDNGVGIPEELHTRIFDEYYRAPTIVERVRGSGLGLAIVESTIQRLPDHRLRLQSREAQGTRVKIYIPGA
ncbi:MAG: HAMP domain-containing sensor histidine kinase [Burkholderiaceae bacterium]